jgi:tRNA(Arg) A34 adenosine deaminase TadA
MSAGGEMDRRKFLARSAGASAALVGAAPAAQAQSREPPSLEEGFNLSAPPLVSNWRKQLGDVTQINFDKEAGELNHPAVQERHQIYSYLLMKLIHRFWNGNKNGPLGTYPQRTKQLEKGRTDRYGGDIHERSDRAHIPWDRYIGHNIACVAVDGLGRIIDFDFNHNPFFRNTVEHAESRLVRRLFSLTDVFDSWRAGRNINNKPHAALLSEVTLYTSLESCAQCSGMMSLAGVKQVIYMQSDFTTYKIGNIMFNLANRATARDDDGHVITNSDGTDKTIPGAPMPIPASRIGLERPFNKLNDANIEFVKKMRAGSEPFFMSLDGKLVDQEPSITSFLCTDAALDIFKEGGDELDKMVLQYKKHPFPEQGPLPTEPSQRMLTNEECLDEAHKFFEYVDIEGYRGSPHKL